MVRHLVTYTNFRVWSFGMSSPSQVMSMSLQGVEDQDYRSEDKSGSGP